MKPTTGWLIAALFVAAGAGWWLIASHESSPRRHEVPAGTTEIPRLSPSPQTAKTADPPIYTAPFAREVTAAEPPDEEDGPPEAQPNGVPVSGRVVVVDADGIEHDHEDGEFHLDYNSRVKPKKSLKVAVSSGTWSIILPPDEAIFLKAGRFGGCAATLPRYVKVPESREITLRAYWARGFRIRVMGKDTQADLKELMVVREKGHVWSGSIHPGVLQAHPVVHRRATSPIHIPPRAEVQKLWVHSPGYAWGKISLGPGIPDELQLVLQPAATLVVHTRESDGLEDLTLRLFKPRVPLPRKADGERKNLERWALGLPCGEFAADKSGTTVIEGLSPGTFAITANTGRWMDNHEHLDWAEVRLRSGTRASATLNLAQSALETERVPLSGTVVFHESWSRPRFYLTISRAREATPTTQRRIVLYGYKMKRVTERPCVLAWDAGLVSPGRYEASMGMAVGMTFVFEVGPTGNTEQRLLVPPMVRLSLKVVDKITGQRILNASVGWSVERPEGATSGGHGRSRFDPETGLFRIQCPEGRIRIAARAPGIEWEHTYVQARLPETQVTMPLGRPQGVRLILMYRGAPKAINRDLKVATSPVGKRERIPMLSARYVSDWSASATALIYPTREPGRYRVTFKDGPAGFEPLSPCEVEVVPGRITDLRVNLVKKP